MRETTSDPRSISQGMKPEPGGRHIESTNLLQAGLHARGGIALIFTGRPSLLRLNFALNGESPPHHCINFPPILNRIGRIKAYRGSALSSFLGCALVLIDGAQVLGNRKGKGKGGRERGASPSGLGSRDLTRR